MPIIRAADKLIYFAHVPKCGGTGIEGMLTQRFGPRARGMLDPGHFGQPEALQWGRTSPQHLDAPTLYRLFPAGFFDAMFAVVRHPVLRLRSVYLYHRDADDSIDPAETFSDWLAALPGRRRAAPFYLDNHARPMNDMVPANARIFRLEEGIAPLVEWLDTVTGSAGGPRDVSRQHSLSERLQALGKSPKGAPVTLTPDHVSQVRALDPEDFLRFGYPDDPAQMADGLPALPDTGEDGEGRGDIVR